MAHDVTTIDGSPTKARRFRLPAIPFPVVAIGLLVLLALIGPWIAPYDPLMIGAGDFNAPPSWAHPFGTDRSGRDVLSRVLAGAQLSVFIGIGATLLALLTGGIIGATAALAGRKIGETIMRVIDVIMSLPGILLAIVLATAFGGGAVTTIAALTVIFTPAMARMVRGAVMGELQEDYVIAARLFGTRTIRLMYRHVSLNIAIPILVFATVVSADAIMLEGAMSFIGVGVPPPKPSWGNIVADGRQLVLSGSWWITAFGGLAIFISVLLLNRFADWLSKTFETGR